MYVQRAESRTKQYYLLTFECDHITGELYINIWKLINKQSLLVIVDVVNYWSKHYFYINIDHNNVFV